METHLVIIFRSIILELSRCDRSLTKYLSNLSLPSSPAVNRGSGEIPRPPSGGVFSFCPVVMQREEFPHKFRSPANRKKSQGRNKTRRLGGEDGDLFVFRREILTKLVQSELPNHPDLTLFPQFCARQRHPFLVLCFVCCFFLSRFSRVVFH